MELNKWQLLFDMWLIEPPYLLLGSNDKIYFFGKKNIDLFSLNPSANI